MIFRFAIASNSLQQEELTIGSRSNESTDVDVVVMGLTNHNELLVDTTTTTIELDKEFDVTTDGTVDSSSHNGIEVFDRMTLGLIAGSSVDSIPSEIHSVDSTYIGDSAPSSTISSVRDDTLDSAAEVSVTAAVDIEGSAAVGVSDINDNADILDSGDTLDSYGGEGNAEASGSEGSAQAEASGSEGSAQTEASVERGALSEINNDSSVINGSIEASDGEASAEASDIDGSAEATDANSLDINGSSASSEIDDNGDTTISDKTIQSTPSFHSFTQRIQDLIKTALSLPFSIIELFRRLVITGTRLLS